MSKPASVKRLVQQLGGVNGARELRIMAAALQGKLAWVRHPALRDELQNLIDLSSQAVGVEPFHVAFRRRDRALMKLLAQLGCDIDKPQPDGSTVTDTAKHMRDADMVRFLSTLSSDLSLAARPAWSPAASATQPRQKIEVCSISIFCFSLVAQRGTLGRAGEEPRPRAQDTATLPLFSNDKDS